MFVGYRHCKRCGKPLMGLFDGALCDECEKAEQESTDAISREAVLKEFEKGTENLYGRIDKLPSVTQKSVIEDIKADLTNEANEHMAEGDYDDGVRFGLMLAEQIVCLHLGKAHKSGKWIPFSERLPKPFEHCLITTTDGEVIYHYDDGQYSKYKAWMPLPKPYEPQERSE